MPEYDISLWDFLKYASKRGKQFGEGKTLDVFPLGERIEMTKRICDGLLYMHKVKSMPHRDLKPRFVYQKLILIQSVLLSVIAVNNFENFQSNIMINVHTNEESVVKWKSGPEHAKSAVITDYEPVGSIRFRDRYMNGKGTAGWASPEQWLGQFTKWSVFICSV